MKLSTIFIIAAAIISLAMLTAYNFSLKASYQKGGYKDRFNELEFSSIKGLTELHVNAANRFAISIEKGDKEGLWIRDQVKGLVNVSQVGNALTIDLTNEAKERGFHTKDGDIILFSNSLNTINTAPYFTKEQKEKEWFYNHGEIRVKDLSGELLDLRLGKFTSVYMDHVKVNTLKARVGEAGFADAFLTVDSSNQIAFADLSIPGRSTIVLLNPKIVKTHYNLSDSATVTLNGSMLKGIRP
ncbi:hypothetical protein [Pedobacter steynii]|uniref:Uncharacterized protein n=1 Tax=Pedobacter steynii TaxID=430522 RepID=A0A1D7QI26_9SPHI|nr:hypothetical protein [Pedobacter steynii]AOM78293.1 hypothetical protein BFS30_14600 [Pedobacter steynii]